MKGVFLHKALSVYDDDPATRYHFPAQYKTVTDTIAGDWVLYYEPGRAAQHYKAVARVNDIMDDPVARDRRHYYARIESGTYLDFVRTVPFRQEDGTYNNAEIERAEVGRRSFLMRRSVRTIPDADFVRIVETGLREDENAPESLPRDEAFDSPASHAGMQEGVPSFDTPFKTEVTRREIETVLTRNVRDRAFRTGVLGAYGSRCAFTRLRFINGGGRAEVQAAHIRPVANGGSDSVQNGIALSGTVHWMFDRGLLSVADDHSILVSRHVNNVDEVDRIIPERTMVVPQDVRKWPHPDALRWHRENVFKT